jgi:MOSC domain-containing protein YiiM
MAIGKLVSIHISQAEGGQVVSLPQVHAIPGRGLEGDRYYYKYLSNPPTDAGWQVTLIEVEAIEMLATDLGIHLTPGQTRRNLTTRGVRLNELAGKEFAVGSVRLVGVRLCDPCDFLESQTAPGVLKALVKRGGLRADILSEGIMRVGDRISN